MNHIYIESDKNKTSIAIVEDDELVEYFIDKKRKRKILGNIYRARVENVLKGLQAAFVNIGEEKNAYLSLIDATNQENKLKTRNQSKDNILRAGEEIIVQVIKEAIDDKGAKITTNWSLTGRYIDLKPFRKNINISRYIKNSKDRKRLSNIGKEIIKNDIGFDFKAESKDIEKNIISSEYESLLRIYKSIEAERNFLPTPKLLFEEQDLVYRIIRENSEEKTYNITVNDKEIYKNIKKLKEKLDFDINLYLDENLNFKYNVIIQKGLKIALSRKVNLQSGGSIVIDETEALTVIDVNTSKHIGVSSLEETILKTNLEAVDEIAKQIKLRNIGGIIIIDFIDLKNNKNIEKMMNSLKEAFSKDKNEVSLIGITKLGLVEITRKRERASLSSEMLIECSSCGDMGE